MTWDTFDASRKVPGRYMHTALWTGKSLLVFGGRSNNNKLVQKKICVQLPVDSETGAPEVITPVASTNTYQGATAAARSRKRS